MRGGLQGQAEDDGDNDKELGEHGERCEWNERNVNVDQDVVEGCEEERVSVQQTR